MFTLYNYYCSLVFSNLKQCFLEVMGFWVILNVLQQAQNTAKKFV